MELWDQVLIKTYADNAAKLDKYLDCGDVSKFKAKFKQLYLETAREWLRMVYRFWHNDDVKDSIWISMADNEDEMEEEEALDIAVDFRKYKIWKTIDWNRVRDIVADDEEDVSEVGEDDSNSEEDESQVEADTESIESDAEVDEEKSEDSDDQRPAKTRRITISKI